MHTNQSVKCLIDSESQPWVNNRLAKRIFGIETRARWTQIKTLPKLIQVHDYRDSLIAVTILRQLLLITSKSITLLNTDLVGKIKHSHLWGSNIVLINEDRQLYCHSLDGKNWACLADDVKSIASNLTHLTWTTRSEDGIISTYNGKSVNQFQISCLPIALIGQLMVGDDMSIRIMEIFDERQLRFDRFFRSWNFQADYEIKDVALYPTDHVTILDHEGRTHRYYRNGKLHRIAKNKIDRFIRDSRGNAHPVFKDGTVVIDGVTVTEFKV